jgi:predicted unusual protein kinase regulating ubiquinone biosynthesis (AarF/ABC1/UbiB family)
MIFLVYIIKYSTFVYSLYKLNKFQSIQNIQYVNDCAISCGPLAIKLLQLIIMGDKKLLKTDKLDFVLENCIKHTFDKTCDLYFQDFGHDITDDYEFHSFDGPVVGSGSIGQVYKVYSKKRKEYIAMKVKHPGINNLVNETVYALKTICFLLKYVNKYHHIFIEFINNIYLQIDYIQEAKNTIKLKQNFINNKCIIVPEIYNYTNNFIIMSYHYGEQYHNVDENLQVLSSMMINFFYMTSLLIHDFIHADLHYGNWKIVKENNETKLLIYDCGIMCSTGDLELNNKIMKCIYNRKNLINLLDIIKEKEPLNKNIEKYRKEFEDIILFSDNSNDCVISFLNKIIELRLVKHRDLIQVLSCIAIIGDTPKKSVQNFTKYLRSNLTSNTILFHTYVGVLTKMDIFHDLIDFFTKELESDPTNKELYEDWLYKEFGHKKGYLLNNIIYNKFYPENL